MSTTQTPAQQLAASISPDTFKPRHDAVSVDRVAMAAAHIRSHWGDYGYSLSIELSGFSGTVFRGHHFDGSDFYFVVDRYCNVADVPQA